jgi:hypothetical protein
MRIFKASFSFWFDPNWSRAMRLKENWKKRAYWLVRSDHALTLGPVRFEMKLEGAVKVG